MRAGREALRRTPSATLGTGKGAFQKKEGASLTVAGRVAGLWRYPVKSMAAEELRDVDVSWHGLAGDRRWAFIRPGQERSGFPWLTMREHPGLAHHQPRGQETHAVIVRTPAGRELDAPGPDFPEDAWLGRILKIGGLRMRVDQRDQRCVIVTIDPVTLDRDRAILRAIAKERGNRFGVYGTPAEPGRITLGDPVELEPR